MGFVHEMGGICGRMGGDGRRWEEMGRHGEMVRTNREAVARDLRRDGGGINR